MPAKRPNGEARGRRGPTTPPPQPPGLSSVLERNIQALGERRKREEAGTTVQEKIAETITRFTGSMVTGEPPLRFYAGAVLQRRSGCQSAAYASSTMCHVT